MLTLYTLLLVLFSPLVFLGFVWRYGLRRTLRGLGERFVAGEVRRRPPERGTLWIHAASVGEVRAAEPFLRALPGRFPGLDRALTTTTVAGKELAETLGVAEEVRLAPADLPFCVSRLIRRWNPRAVVLIETELWPHWIRTLSRLGVPVAVVNGRLSDGSFRSYLWLRPLMAPLLARLSRVGVQSPRYASRFIQAGAGPDRVAITGNLKYDVPLPDLAARDAVFERYGFRPGDRIWVCGSTHEGEEEILADAYLALRRADPAVKWVLAPRHVERAAAVGNMLTRKGLPWFYRSRLSRAAEAPVMVLDTLGELPQVYGLAVFAFVGGSLVPRGGQNPLEPARWGVPVLFGPRMENFREMADLFLAENAAWRVSSGESLAARLLELLRDPDAARELGRAARQVADSQRGAVERNLQLLEEALTAPAGPAGCEGCP